jgi:predicted RNA polymerase sigma factor
VTDVATVEASIADTHRREWARVLAATVRVARDLDLAEECVQEAYAAALEAWVGHGKAARDRRDTTREGVAFQAAIAGRARRRSR